MGGRGGVHRAGRWLLYAAAALLLLAIAGTFALKMALNRVPEYQAQIKSWVHDQTGFYVRFSEVRPSLRWYGPELHFDRLELRSKDDRRTLAHARAGSIALDVWKLLASGKLLAGRIRIEEPQFDIVRLGPDRFSFASEIEFGRAGGDPRARLQGMPRGKLTVRDAVVTVRGWNAALPVLQFRSVDLDLTRRNGLVDFDLNGMMPEALKGSFSVRLGADDLYESGPLHWQTRMVLRDVSLPGWHDLLPAYSNALDSGSARVDLSARFQGAAVAHARMDFTAFRVGIAKQAEGSHTLREVGGVFELDHAGDSWRLVGRRVRALESAAAGRETEFKANWRTDGGALREIDAECDYLRLDALLPVVSVLPQQELRERIAALGLRGDWFDTELRYARAAAGAAPKWTVRARFANAALAPFGRAPGWQGLTGSIYGDERSGGIELRAPGARIDWLSEWPQIVGLDTLQGSLFWQRQSDGYLLATQNLAASNPDLKLTAKFALRTHDDGRSPDMTLAGVVSDVDTVAAPKYLPRLHISPKGLAWLNRAFVAGRIRRADLVLRGPLRKFPFRDDSGLFLVRFPAEGLTLDYHEKWPRMENLALDAEFRNQGLWVRIRHGTSREIVLDRAEAVFEDFKTGELKVHAVSHTDARAAVDFLANTPVDAMAEQAFSKVQAAGSLDADVDLFFPFKQFDQRRVVVTTRLNGVSLALKGSRAAATDLRGDVLIDGAQVPRAQLKGQALGGALQVRARPPHGTSDRSTQLELRGVMTAEGLRAAFELPENALRGGRSDWRGTVRLAPGAAHERWVRATSTLVGLEIGLPEPFAKAADESMPMFIHVDWPRPFETIVRAGLSPVMRGVLQFDAAGGDMRLARGTVLFGTEAPALAADPGLRIGGTVKRLDLAAWLRARGAPAGGASWPAVAEHLSDAHVKVDEIDLRGVAIRDVVVALEPGRDAWRVGLDGPHTSGAASVPRSATAAWDFKFARLRLDEASTAGSAGGGAGTGAGAGSAAAPAMPTDPRAVPALHFQSDAVDWRDRQIGAVDIAISKREDGVNLDRLHVASPNFVLDAHGSWRGPQQGLGHLEGAWTSSDVKQTLAQLGYADVIHAKAGSMEFNLDWTGPPSAGSVASLNGSLKLSADKGQIVALNPGAGRMLGLASVATLPRRLALDFSDLTDKGLAFDTIRGDFQLTHGDAFTSNTLLRGPAAEIGLIGRVGLANQDFDQTAVVTGNFGNSLPLASTLVAGPVVGAAVLVFSQVFKQPLKGLARGYYRITGSWDNPIVERVKSDEAAAATRRESKGTEGTK